MTTTTCWNCLSTKTAEVMPGYTFPTCADCCSPEHLTDEAKAAARPMLVVVK